MSTVNVNSSCSRCIWGVIFVSLSQHQMVGQQAVDCKFACRHSFCSSCMWAVNVFAKFANNFHCPAPSWWEFSDRWRQYLLVRISFRSGMEKLEPDHWPTNWIWTVVKQALVLAPEFLSSSNQLGFFRGCKLTNSVKNDLLLRNPKQRTKHQQAQTVF